MRIINAAAVSCGTQNEQMMGQARKFISENRLWMLTVFKRAAKIGARGDEQLDESVEDLADAYMLLISVSGFLDVSVESTNPCHLILEFIF
jgi:nuclear pore complex protein Nup205